MKIRRVIFPLALLLVVAMTWLWPYHQPDAVQASPAALSPAWTQEAIVADRNLQDPGPHYLARDADDHLHLALTGRALYHVWWDGAGWQEEIVDQDFDSGSPTAIALDISGYPHIAYINFAGKLKYAYKTAGGWMIETVFNPGVAAGVSSVDLKLTFTGLPEIAFIDYYDFMGRHYRVRHAKKLSDGSWNIETITASDNLDTQTGISLGYTSGAFWGQFYPHVVYCEGDKVKHADRTSGAWQIEQIANEGCNSTPLLATDSQNRLHVGFNAGSSLTTFNVRHAVKDNGAWTLETVDSGADLYGLAMVRNASDEISFSYKKSGALVLAQKTLFPVPLWLVTTLDDQADAGNYAGMITDSNGNPLIVHFRAEDRKWNVVSWNGSEWIHQTIFEDWSLLKESSLAFDGGGAPHIAFRSYAYPAIQYARKVNGAWEHEIVDTGSYLYLWERALAIDSQGNPHLVYDNRADSDGEIIYAWRGPSGWVTETVQTSGEYPSLALDSQDRPWIAFNEESGPLKVLHWNGTTWASETITSYGLYPKLLLDSDDVPHLTYAMFVQAVPRYATKVGGTWVSQDIDPTAETICVSLALNSAGQPAVAYFDFAANQHVYAFLGSGGWNRETVYSTLGAPADVECSVLAFDRVDRPHIIFFEYGTQALYHAFKSDTGWLVEVISDEGMSYADFPSAAMDGRGRLGVSSLGWDGLQYYAQIGYDIFLPLLIR